MFTLAIDPAWRSIRRGFVLSLLACAGVSIQTARATQANWFPDSPTFRFYSWTYQPCPGCRALAPRPAWARMAALAGLPDARFQIAPDESSGQAYSAAPDVVVLSPAALQLEKCQLAFLVGHELVHIARRHFDADAIALSVFSGKPAHWTSRGEDVMRLAEGDFGLALRVAHLWQEQEDEADWMGSLLAAHASGCSIESSAIAYFHQDGESGGGLAAAHAPSAERVRHLLPFAESARRLALLAPR